MQSLKDSTPFEYLLSIDRLCQEKLGGLIQEDSQSSVAHGLAFKVGGHQYIVPITDINEVLAINEFTRLPRVSNWLMGIANIRGNLVTLVDLHQLLFGTPSKAEKRSKRVLLIQQESNHFGLQIDSIIGMKPFSSETGTNEIPSGFNPDLLDHVASFHASGEEWYAALSIQSLLHSDGFKNICY